MDVNILHEMKCFVVSILFRLHNPNL